MKLSHKIWSWNEIINVDVVVVAKEFGVLGSQTSKFWEGKSNERST